MAFFIDNVACVRSELPIGGVAGETHLIKQHLFI